MSSVTNKGRELALEVFKGKKTPEWGALTACSTICRHAATLHRLAEESCNGHPMQANPYIDARELRKLQDKWDARIDRQEDRTEGLITDAARRIKAVKGVKFSGDPRGCVVKLVLKSGRTNDFAQEGICVP